MALHKQQEELLQSLLKGPLPHNVRFEDVSSLVDHLGTVTDHGHGKVMFKIRSKERIFQHPRGKHLTTEELSDVRHFLISAEVGALEQLPETRDRACIVVIDHRSARLFMTSDTARPTPAGKVDVYDPHGFHRHLIHRKEASYQGDRVPEEDSFYKQVAEALATAPSIVIIGHGVGKSNAAGYLMDYLKKHFSAVASRVNEVKNADLSALTEPEIESLAVSHLG
jgi:hypothetical protein